MAASKTLAEEELRSEWAALEVGLLGLGGQAAGVLEPAGQVV